ncbi:hypothetical protein G6F24_015438 [Rhizopus arrhizus]|nr:hypothetical protein G6F24_015438 [Rhizopus arrhizus]
MPRTSGYALLIVPPDRIGGVAVLAVAAEAQLELVGGIDLLGFGVERVEGAGPAVVRPELDGGHHAIALVVAGAAQRLDAIGEVGARRDSATLALVGVLGGPRLVQADLVFLDRHVAVRLALKRLPYGSTLAARPSELFW